MMRLIGLMSKCEEYCKLEADVGYPQVTKLTKLVSACTRKDSNWRKHVFGLLRKNIKKHIWNVNIKKVISKIKNKEKCFHYQNSKLYLQPRE